MNEIELKQYIIDQAAMGGLIYGNRVADRIYGKTAVTVRQNIMRALTGKDWPKSKCGATAVRDQLLHRFWVPGMSDMCKAEQDRALQMNLEGRFSLEDIAMQFKTDYAAA